MARGDGVNRTTVRNVNLTAKDIENAQRHNEREKESYVNQDIVPERTNLNIHFKQPTGSYQEMFDQMKADGIISTRGLKDGAKTYGELIFDVNSAYFYNNGGYDFAKQFYADAYRAAVEIVGGEDYILSAVMHADERNRAMSEALGQDVYHYHLHVVYVPVVEKQILWSKRCKDEKLRGTVKETVMQVSSSKKWASQPAVDEQGQPLLSKSGKPVLRKSYSILQDQFFQAIRDAGYTDVERGERGSSEEHLTVTQFKVQQEQERLSELTASVQKQEKQLQTNHQIHATFQEIDNTGHSSLLGKVVMTQQEAADLKQLARAGVTAKAKIADLKQELSDARKEAALWRTRYERLRDQTKDFLESLKRAPERVKAFIQDVLRREPEQPQKEHARSRKGMDR